VTGPVRLHPRHRSGAPGAVPNPDNWRVLFLIGEWIPAWFYMSLAFLVATVGVVGLGWWVMRADHLNRRFEDASSDEAAADL